MEILGVDIGGSGLKAALVDLEKGELASERTRIPTPETRVPEDVIPAVVELINQFDYTGPVGVGFPAVVVDGAPVTPFTAHEIESWVGLNVAGEIEKAIGSPVTMVNDADAAGIAEVKFGAGRDKMGTVILLTLGTGIGSALFFDGNLVPNTEFGKIFMQDRKHVSEYYAAEAAREREDLSWSEWAKELDEYMNHLEWLFTPRLFIIGGGISKKHEKYVPLLSVRAPVVPATLRNHAGIIGAAMAAV